MQKVRFQQMFFAIFCLLQMQWMIDAADEKFCLDADRHVIDVGNCEDSKTVDCAKLFSKSKAPTEPNAALPADSTDPKCLPDKKHLS